MATTLISPVDEVTINSVTNINTIVMEQLKKKNRNEEAERSEFQNSNNIKLLITIYTPVT